MTVEIPQYCLKAYALFFSRHKTEEEFKQADLKWLVSESMKKKIFSLLLNAGWIKKKSRNTYQCVKPENIFLHLFDFRVPKLIEKAERDYAFTKLSAVEIWSDHSYVQRGKEKSPYFIKIYEKDLDYWKDFFNKNNIPNYVKEGTTIGEYMILIPVKKIAFREKEGLKVEPLKETMEFAKKNDIYAYPYEYMRKKYGTVH